MNAMAVLPNGQARSLSSTQAGFFASAALAGSMVMPLSSVLWVRRVSSWRCVSVLSSCAIHGPCSMALNDHLCFHSCRWVCVCAALVTTVAQVGLMMVEDYTATLLLAFLAGCGNGSVRLGGNAIHEQCHSHKLALTRSC